jgi:hypothetical protein
MTCCTSFTFITSICKSFDLNLSSVTYISISCYNRTSFQSSRFARGSYFCINLYYTYGLCSRFSRTYLASYTWDYAYGFCRYSYFCASLYYTYGLCSSPSRTYPATYTQNSSCFVAGNLHSDKASGLASNPADAMPQLPSYLHLICATANHQTP